MGARSRNVYVCGVGGRESVRGFSLVCQCLKSVVEQYCFFLLSFKNALCLQTRCETLRGFVMVGVCVRLSLVKWGRCLTVQSVVLTLQSVDRTERGPDAAS